MSVLKPALLITSAGEQKELACFQPDKKTEAFGSCSVNWKNQLHIFGGATEYRQISRLSGFKLERIGDLAFDHESGSCSLMANQFIFYVLIGMITSYADGQLVHWRTSQKYHCPVMSTNRFKPVVPTVSRFSTTWF